MAPNPEQLRERSKDQLEKRNSETISNSPDQIKHDLAEYVIGFETMEDKEKQAILEKTKQFETKQDYDLIKSMGYSVKELEQDPLKRHLELSAIYLKRDKQNPLLAFDVDFLNNEAAEWGLDLTDLLPANILAVDIYDQNGALIYENATRSKKENKTGYFEKSGQRAEIQTGFKIVVKKSQPVEAIKERKYGRRAYLNGAQEIEEMVYNSAVTEVKDKARQEAQKKGEKLDTGKDFYDKVFDDLTNALSSTIKRFQETGKLDLVAFAPILEKMLSEHSYQIDQAEDEILNAQEEKEKQKTKQADIGVTQSAPEDLPKDKSEPILQHELPEGISESSKVLIQTARSYIGSKQFRGREVAGGKLACAQVASTILKEAGLLSKVHLSVNATEKALLRRGWKIHRGKAKAGDVVIWGRTPSRMVDGIARPGHRHIGIMTSQDYTVNNSSSSRMPLERKLDYNSPRGIYFLSPPV
ncbi:hypothetical protein GF376_00625 [Candidatus Peregrinibacteria bacterium]|nr:hypothetical protein [Candidatus Peregrinibacteria bacterium]